MAIDAALSVAQLLVVGRIHGQDYRNVIHFATDTVGFDANPVQLLNNLISDWRQRWEANLMPVLSNEFEWIATRAKRIVPNLSDEAESTVGAGPGGTVAPALPSHNRQTIFKRSGKGGRKGKGNIHLPPPTEAQHDKGLITEAQAAALQAFIDAITPVFIGDAGSSVWHLGVLQNVYNVPVPPAKRQIIDRFWHPTAQLTVDRIVGRSGRRRIGRGS